jgi:hypothetical protein
MAGYSGTPLPKKLGMKDAHRVALLHAPPNFAKTLVPMPADVTIAESLAGKQPIDVILLFCKDQKTLTNDFPKAAARLAQNGGLWVCWPKKSSGVATDLTENPIRNLGLAAGLVDNKVCAVDETWSGLRFVIRVKDRKA